MVALLGFEWTQRQALAEQGSKRVDSVTAPAFLLDREFLRFVNCVDLFLEVREPYPAEELRTRLDIFLSKIDTVRQSPGSALLLQIPEVAQSVEQMAVFGQRAERALSGNKPDMRQLHALLEEMQDFTAQSLAIGNSADLLGSKLLEQQTHDLLKQNLQILWLTVGSWCCWWSWHGDWCGAGGSSSRKKRPCCSTTPSCTRRGMTQTVPT